MTAINPKPMLKVPKTRAEAARITSARCPACRFYAAIDFSSKGPHWVFCAHCSESWEIHPVAGGL